MSRIGRIIDWIASHEQAVLAGWLVIVAVVWGFFELAGMVTQGSTQAFDERVVRALRCADDLARPIGPEGLTQIARDITALGSYSALIVVVLISVLFLAAARQRVALRTLFGATISGYAMLLLLKQWFHRPRPEIVPHLADFHSSSFPSGHAMMSAVIYVTLAFQLLRVIEPRQIRCAILITAVLLTTLVGVSRVFLGVHYPTDVLAGWTGGLVWASLWLVLARRWQQKHDRLAKPL